ncbi:MBOAT family O-acyltransferase [Pedobacter montanisoli]|uniref:MBOAT family protein n=1 Tax=Pedobacter montanisoli TaxID=2923277 RepID=A0ABS9ZXB0_9SPHI|nr:MBOAT family O-acyltransferase [Pedobacter montanisoli]MCJ0742959.1 MBOAT family protein [Pedobacter montanisoli]
MLFSSLSFFIFFPIVFILYWSLFKYRKAQNIVLLLASYVFYGWWDWRFCVLLLLSSVFGFFMAKSIDQTNSQKRRNLLMTLSVIVHVGILCYFKYFNFFVSSFVDLANSIGWQLNFIPIKVILPLAISFFTFHILGYTFDVYQGKYRSSNKFIAFITHIAFFPQLVAGPIERANHLLPQFENDRKFSLPKLEDGFMQMLWGFFKKIVIADGLAMQVNYIFANYHDLNGITIALGIIMFTFQMYCDFSGYSDIALGCARMMGFELLQNFNYPFFSQSISEFWRKWHISLSSWIQDYLFTPISFKRRNWGKFGIFYAALVSFTLSGLWHGANWTFIVWGALHGLAIGYELLTKKKRKKVSKKFNPLFYAVTSGIIVFIFWCFTQLIFRAESLHHAWGMLQKLFTGDWLAKPEISLTMLLWIAGLLAAEWIQRHKPYALAISNTNFIFKWSVCALLIMIIFSSKNLNNQTEFLYFQF